MENSVGNGEFRYGEWIYMKTYPQLFTVKILTMAGDWCDGKSCPERKMKNLFVCFHFGSLYKQR